MEYKSFLCIVLCISAFGIYFSFNRQKKTLNRRTNETIWMKCIVRKIYEINSSDEYFWCSFCFSCYIFGAILFPFFSSFISCGCCWWLFFEYSVVDFHLQSACKWCSWIDVYTWRILSTHFNVPLASLSLIIIIIIFSGCGI